MCIRMCLRMPACSRGRGCLRRFARVVERRPGIGESRTLKRHPSAGGGRARTTPSRWRSGHRAWEGGPSGQRWRRMGGGGRSLARPLTIAQSIALKRHLGPPSLPRHAAASARGVLAASGGGGGSGGGGRVAAKGLGVMNGHSRATDLQVGGLPPLRGGSLANRRCRRWPHCRRAKERLKACPAGGGGRTSCLSLLSCRGCRRLRFEQLVHQRAGRRGAESEATGRRRHRPSGKHGAARWHGAGSRHGQNR